MLPPQIYLLLDHKLKNLHSSQPLILIRHFEAAAFECFAAAGVTESDAELISASIPRSDTEPLCQEGAEF